MSRIGYVFVLYQSAEADPPFPPRYRIGDTIIALRPPYFRCIGRDNWWTPLRYAWDEFMTLNLGRL